MRLTTMTDYALRLLIYLGQHRERLCTTAEIAQAYAISEAFGWREGLYRKFKRAHGFYGVIVLATILGFFMNLLGLDPIRSLIWCAVLNGLISPVVLFLIVRLSGNEKIMGKWKNGSVVQMIGWLVTVAMAVVGVATLWALWA